MPEPITDAARALLETIDQGAPYCVGYTVNSVPVWRKAIKDKVDALRRALSEETAP